MKPLNHERQAGACARWWPLAAVALLTACARIPTLPPGAAPMDGKAAGVQASSSLTEPASAWWTAFGAAQLDALIERALNESPSLAAAEARLRRASAAAEAAGAAELPQAGLGVDAMRQRYTENGLVPKPVAGSTRSTATLQIGASYEFDFVGRNKAALEAALGRQQAAAADADAARLLLATQMTRSYIGLARVLAQTEFLDAQIGQRQQLLGLMAQRRAAGLDGAQEQGQAELPLLELQRQRQQLDEQAGLLRNQLAALSAQPVAALATLKPRLPQALPLDAAGEPGLDLLGRRPDVRAARRLVEAGLHQVDEARAQFYPNVSLTAFAGFNAIGLDRLLEAGSRQYGIGPALRLPLFDSGRLRAQLRGASSDADAAVAQYNSVLLEAVRDARDQLLALRSLQAQQPQQAQALAQSRALEALAEQRHAAGLGNRMGVLNAQFQTTQQQRQDVELRAQLLTAQAGLLRSLGGGFSDAGH
ncbi:MAG: RND transporter [Methylibium sp.]|nr:RND transporter [Methylibium sp.]